MADENSLISEESFGGDQVIEMYELGGLPEADSSAETDSHDWSMLTVAALKAELAERGLQTTGRKADLVARLEANAAGCYYDNFIHIILEHRVKIYLVM